MVPDVAQLTRSSGGGRGGGGGGRGGGRGGNLRGGGGDNLGVGGLKELGVRDLTYKLCFLASSVRHAHSSVRPFTVQFLHSIVNADAIFFGCLFVWWLNSLV